MLLMNRITPAAELKRSLAKPAHNPAARIERRLAILGSAGVGKSTLTARLVYENSPALVSGTPPAPGDAERIVGGIEGDRRFAEFFHGLQERHGQDSATAAVDRGFATAKRSFRVAVPSGHDPVAPGTVTAAAEADVAVIVIDAGDGGLTQALPYATMASLLGIRHVVVAVNKMDLAGFAQSVFERDAAGFESFAAKLDFKSLSAVPISARSGDNVCAASGRMPWYRGPTLLAALDAIEVEDEQRSRPFRMPVQSAERRHGGLSECAGRIASGRVRPGDAIVVAGSGRASKVKRIVTADGDCDEALAGDPVTLVLEDDAGIVRGDMLADPTARPQVADQFAAHLIWLGDSRLLPGRSYLMKLGEQTVPATITAIKICADVPRSATAGVTGTSCCHQYDRFAAESVYNAVELASGWESARTS
jgi:bifunctional enzyme CysN/CysC